MRSPTTTGYDCSPSRAIGSSVRKVTVKMRPSWSAFDFVSCGNGDRPLLSGVLPQPRQPESPPALAPAPANAKAAAPASATRPSHDALARPIRARNRTLGPAPWGCARLSRRGNLYRCVEVPVGLTHEMRRGPHAHAERAARVLGDVDLVPARRLRVEERDAPRRRRFGDDAGVLPRDPELRRLVDRRLRRLHPRLAGCDLVPACVADDHCGRAAPNLVRESV